jgi:D-alanyl-D-alanine carboxypeptidase (penicillin-binding protein 5/6)
MLRVLPLLLVLLARPALGESNIAPLPAIDAKAWLLLDLQSRQVIASHAADQRLEPASLTKLMSAYVVFDALEQKRLRLDQRLPVSVKAWRMPGARMFLEPNTSVTVDELLRGMIVVSGNDATIALSEGVAGSEEAFVRDMNKHAERLMLAGTRFANPTGLPDPQHYSTAADVGRLAEAVVRDFPEFLPLFSLRSYTYNGITQVSRNRLLGRDPRVDGMKTGHTENAGYCMVATARSQERHLLAVVAGAASESARAIQAQKLLNYGFQYYTTVRLYPAGSAVAELPVWKGSASRLKVGFERDFYVSIPRGAGDLLKATLTSQQPLLAPLSAQQRVGVLHLTFDGKPLGEYPVVALESVGVANMFLRIWDGLRLLLNY